MYTKQKNPVPNTLGAPSRMNLDQIYETVLGEIDTDSRGQ